MIEVNGGATSTREERGGGGRGRKGQGFPSANPNPHHLVS